jgi:ketosteroid isomerase-like protein
MQHPNIDLVHRLYGAYQAGDTDTVAAAFSADVRWSTSGWGPATGTAEGLPAVLAYLFEDNHMDDYGLEVRDILVSDDHVAVVARSCGRRGVHTIVNDYVQLIRIVDGRVVEVRNFNWDQRALAEFMAIPMAAMS